MKAIVYTQYGSPDVLQLKDVEKPAPKPDEVLIRVRATSVNFGDLVARKFNRISPREFSMPMPLWLLSRVAMGVSRPKKTTLGNEFAGDIEAVGSSVSHFKVGDSVFGYRGPSMGTNAEYICIPENGMLALKPHNMTYEEAAAVPYGALTALSLLRKVNIQRGEKVLVNGASGSIGSYAVQLARHFGAEVTGVCGTLRVQMVKALGAERVIDYTQEDFTQSGETYDLIFDVLGKSSFSRCKRVLKPNGRYLLASFKMKQLAQMLWTSITGGKRVICTLSSERPEDLRFIKDLVEAGELKTVLDRCFPLEQTAEAHRYIEAGRRQASVVITLDSHEPARLGAALNLHPSALASGA